MTLPVHVEIGGTYWAPFGTKRWSAVVVRDIINKDAKAQRVKPLTNELYDRITTVDATKLLPRDPSLLGKDKPKVRPSKAFKKKPQKVAKPVVRKSRVDHLLALLPDKSRIEDWEPTEKELQLKKKRRRIS